MTTFPGKRLNTDTPRYQSNSKAINLDTYLGMTQAKLLPSVPMIKKGENLKPLDFSKFNENKKNSYKMNYRANSVINSKKNSFLNRNSNELIVRSFKEKNSLLIMKNRLFIPRNYYCSKTINGQRPYNQDRLTIAELIMIQGQQCYFYGIYDGHGGSSTAQFLCQNLHKIFKSYIRQELSILVALQKSIQQTQDRLKKNSGRQCNKNSGSCALVCVISKQNIYIANVGDSRAIKIDKNDKIRQITTDHKPENPKQKQRIQISGGKIYRNLSQSSKSYEPFGPYRVFPSGLSVSRTLGDITIKKHPNNSIICKPELIIQPYQNGSTIVLMSDGLYEKMQNYEIGQCFLYNQNIQDAIDVIMRISIRKSTNDNTSVIAIKCN